MTTLLITSSLFGAGGQSTTLANELVSRLGGKVVVRDLAKDPVPHLDGERFSAFNTTPGARTPAQQAVIDYSDALIAQLKAADTVVIGVPMYNFGIPSTLKAYFDHVARAGITFRYTDKGPEGLLKGKKVVVFATRGGMYAGTPRDTQSAYLKDFLAFLGLEDVEFVYAEGLAMGAEQREAALEAAGRRIDAIAA